MSHLRLVPATEETEFPESAAPSPGAARFAGFTPMNEQPGLADRKAMFVTGASGLMLSTALMLVAPIGQFVRPGWWPLLVLSLSIALACTVVLALHAAYRAYILQAPDVPKNLLFFRNIAAGPAGDYAGRLEALTPRDVLLDVLAYNHTMARLGVDKYRLVGRAMRRLQVAIPLWVTLVLLMTARGA